MTKIKDVIEKGQPIPDDVLGFEDRDGDAWAPARSGVGWLMAHNVERYPEARSFTSEVVSNMYGPLTVTAVREVEHCGNLNYIHEPHDSIVLINESEAIRKRCPGTCPEPEPDDVLDLVRQYGDAKFAVGDELDGGSDEAFHGGRAKAFALFARIEAEVQRLRTELDRPGYMEQNRMLIAEVERLRAEVRIEREAEERANAELKDIVRRLDEAEVDSGGVSERVGYVIQSMQRARAQATDSLARLDTVKADRETTRAALQHLKDTVTRPAIRALGVQHNEEVVPAIERLKADLRAVDDLVQDDLMQQPDPLVLSLPQVPPGTVALVFRQPPAREIRFTLTEGPLPWRMVDDAGESHYWALLDLLAHFGPVTVVKREPRTWPKLGFADVPADPPAAVDLIEPDRSPLRFVRHVGLRGTTRYMEPGHPSTSLTLNELRTLGEVREVFDDEPGGAW